MQSSNRAEGLAENWQVPVSQNRGGGMSRRKAKNQVCRRLWAWGDEERYARDLSGLGYPSVSVCGRIMEEGPAGAAIRGTFGPKVPKYWPDDWIRETAQEVGKLNHEEYQAIRLRYVHRLEMKNVADVLQMPERSLYRFMEEIYRELEKKLR